VLPVPGVTELIVGAAGVVTGVLLLPPHPATNNAEASTQHDPPFRMIIFSLQTFGNLIPQPLVYDTRRSAT
jgi:hypothetical protein